MIIHLSTLTQILLLATVSAQSFRGSDKNWQQDFEEDTFNSGNSRIIGGRESTKGRFSYAVSLQDDAGAFCGGSLIAPDVVMSAAVSRIEVRDSFLDNELHSNITISIAKVVRIM